jgi:uncharacterized protein DUF4190
VGHPGYYGYPPPPRQTNTMAVLALVLAFAVAPAGIVLGVLARKQIRQTGEDGWGLATAGLVLGVVFSAVYAVGIVLWITVFVSIFRHIPDPAVFPTYPTFPTR